MIYHPNQNKLTRLQKSVVGRHCSGMARATRKNQSTTVQKQVVSYKHFADVQLPWKQKDLHVKGHKRLIQSLTKKRSFVRVSAPNLFLSHVRPRELK